MSNLSRVWQIGHGVACFFCLAPGDAMSFRVTKKGGAMLTCRACGSRAFLHGHGTRGPELLFGAMSLAMQDGRADVARKILEGAVVEAKPNVTVQS